MGNRIRTRTRTRPPACTRIRARTSVPVTLALVPLAVVIAVAVAVTSFSFPHAVQVRARTRTRTCPRRPSSQRFAFAWFNSNGKDSKDSKDSNSPDNSPDHDSAETTSLLSDASTIMESFKTSQRLGERTGEVLQELSYTFVEGSSAEGKVKVTFNGQQIPIGVKVDETYLEDLVSNRGKDGIEEFCSALTNAMQDAHYKSGIKVEEKMKSLYSDLDFESE